MPKYGFTVKELLDLNKFIVKLLINIWNYLHIFFFNTGACIFATTLSDHETAAEKCEEDEEGYDGCSEYLYSEFKLINIAVGLD